jgi:hypothetical protein
MKKAAESGLFVGLKRSSPANLPTSFPQAALIEVFSIESFPVESSGK